MRQAVARNRQKHETMKERTGRLEPQIQTKVMAAINSPGLTTGLVLLILYCAFIPVRSTTTNSLGSCRSPSSFMNADLIAGSGTLSSCIILRWNFESHIACAYPEAPTTPTLVSACISVFTMFNG